MAFMTKSVAVQALDDTRWVLLRGLAYVDDGGLYQVPAGYVTDFASVPRATSWLYPRSGAYTPAAILHDWLITDLLPTGKITSTRVDEVFLEAMKELGVPTIRRWVLWSGVRLGAIGNPKRRKGSLRTLPKVLLIVLASSPVVLPPSLVVQAMLLILWLVSLVLPKSEKVDAQKQ